MVSCKRQKNLIHKQNMLEVVDDTLAVQKVHGDAEEIPVERLCEAQATGLAWHICNGNDLLEGDDLDGGHGNHYEDVTGAQGPEEASDHDEGPYCARYEVCLFLFILALGLFLDELGACQYVKLQADRGQTYRRRGFFFDGGTPGIAEF